MECQLGTTQLQGADSSSFCQCPPGTYHWSNSGLEEEACIACNEYMEPCSGGVDLPRQKEWYHIPAGGQNVYLCASTAACNGGLLGSCPFGSYGRGCATCVEGEFYWNGKHCAECTEGQSALLVVVPVIFFGVLLATHWFGNDPLGRLLSPISEFLVLAGMSLSIFFFLGSLTALDVAWSKPIRILLSLAQRLEVGLTEVHFTCSVSIGHAFNYAMSSCVPALVALLCFCVGRMPQTAMNKVFNTYCTLVSAFYLLLVLHALKPLRYIVHPTGDKSLLSMPSVFEGSSEHAHVLVVGLSVLMIYCIPFGAMCMWAAVKIMHTRHARTRRSMLVSFRFLFYKFRPEAYYWGVVIIVRNLGLAIMPSIAPEEPAIGVFGLVLVSTISAVHTEAVRPWRAAWMNHADSGIMCYLAWLLNLAAGWVRSTKASDGVLSTSLAVVAFVAAVAALIFFGKLIAQIACMGPQLRARLRKLAEEEQDRLYEQLTGLNWPSECEVAEALDGLVASSRLICKPSTETAGLHTALLQMSRVEAHLKELTTIAQSIRDPDYTLQAYYEDCTRAYPELNLFGTDDDDGGVSVGGRTAKTELQRTIGAMFAVYWMCRLDMDGKQGLAFGVEPDNPYKVRAFPAGITEESLKETPWGKMSPEQRRVHLYYNFDWKLMQQLFVEAGVLKVVKQRNQQEKWDIDARSSGRLVALLSLTACHDIMKVPELCPRVHGDPYCGFKDGETIVDHDLALSYILDRYSSLLPSYRVLTSEQQKVIRFTQSEMGFNAGWLVQAEGPPSAVLGKLKQVITHQQARDADVAFYFAHWVTDLAGAEPTPFRGSEKFAVKFPPHVLQSLMGCFSIVRSLANKTETEVYADYLVSRWVEVSEQLGPVPTGLSRIAKLRLHCMGQQAAKQLLLAFDDLSEDDSRILSQEMAVTGLAGQSYAEWRGCSELLPTNPFLLYYGPAWCQRIGQENPHLSLRVLAEVYRKSRKMFGDFAQLTGKNEAAEERMVYRTIHCAVLKSVSIQALDIGTTYVELDQDNSSEATLSSRSHL